MGSPPERSAIPKLSIFDLLLFITVAAIAFAILNLGSVKVGKQSDGFSTLTVVYFFVHGIHSLIFAAWVSAFRSLLQAGRSSKLIAQPGHVLIWVSMFGGSGWLLVGIATEISRNLMAGSRGFLSGRIESEWSSDLTLILVNGYSLVIVLVWFAALWNFKSKWRWRMSFILLLINAVLEFLSSSFYLAMDIFVESNFPFFDAMEYVDLGSLGVQVLLLVSLLTALMIDKTQKLSRDFWHLFGVWLFILQWGFSTAWVLLFWTSWGQQLLRDGTG